jgi:alpha-N-arabinofuranosidase
MKDGSWWAVFLASRPYQGFLTTPSRDLPAAGELEGWLAGDPRARQVHSLRVKGPKVMKRDAQGGADLLRQLRPARRVRHGRAGHEWLQVHVPKQRWYELTNGTLVIHPLAVRLDEKRNASFYARRQAHQRFAATTELHPPKSPAPPQDSPPTRTRVIGTLRARRVDRRLQLFLERRAGDATETVTTAMVDAPETLRLLINGNGGRYSFFYDAGDGWQLLRDNDDASIRAPRSPADSSVRCWSYARQE